MLKREILDPQGQAVERALPSLGFDGVSDVRIGKHVHRHPRHPAHLPCALCQVRLHRNRG